MGLHKLLWTFFSPTSTEAVPDPVAVNSHLSINCHILGWLEIHWNSAISATFLMSWPHFLGLEHVGTFLGCSLFLTLHWFSVFQNSLQLTTKSSHNFHFFFVSFFCFIVSYAGASYTNSDAAFFFLILKSNKSFERSGSARPYAGASSANSAPADLYGPCRSFI